MGVDDQREVPGVRADPRGGLVGVADEAAVDEGRVPPVDAGAGWRPGTAWAASVTQAGSRSSWEPHAHFLVTEPGPAVLSHHGAGEPLSCCQ